MVAVIYNEKAIDYDSLVAGLYTKDDPDALSDMNMQYCMAYSSGMLKDDETQKKFNEFYGTDVEPVESGSFDLIRGMFDSQKVKYDLYYNLIWLIITDIEEITDKHQLMIGFNHETINGLVRVVVNLGDLKEKIIVKGDKDRKYFVPILNTDYSTYIDENLVDLSTVELKDINE